MKLLVPVFLLLLTLSAYADIFQSKIHSIDIGTKKDDPHLIKMENGRVVFVKQYQKKLLESFKESLKKQETLEIEMDENNRFISVETIDPSTTLMPFYREDENQRQSYDPTVVSSSANATSIFLRMRRDYQNNSQCYNRAHIWAWEEYRKTGLKSLKHFLFFTRRYIRNYRFKWWFHVAPSIVVNGYGTRILDRRYNGGHRSVNDWTNTFVYSRRSCPVVLKYNDYDNNQESQDCYLIPVSMYFWQPRDIVKRDRTGYEKTSFIKSEVDYAYWEAF